MRKLTALCFALLLVTASSAVAAPNDSSERPGANPVIRAIKHVKDIVVRVFDDIQPTVPVPNAPNP